VDTRPDQKIARGDKLLNEALLSVWRKWTFDKSVSTEEKRLRKIISGAYLRLKRLDDSNPEVCHAREILEKGKNGGEGSCP
jgi:hypothetical protein